MTKYTRILGTLGKVARFAAVIGCVSAVSAAEMAAPKYVTDGAAFKCITKMTPVKHYFVDSLSGNLDATVAVAKAGKGVFPEGAVLQLIPNEVMIKQQKGYSPQTNDWEFYYLDVDKDGSKIVSQGAAEVNNRLGLNCFSCHSQAQTGFDFICEQDHGCAPIPIARPMFTALQRSDPRCKDAPPLNEVEKAALVELAEVVKTLTGH